MPHTNGRYQQALGFTDGVLILTPLSAVNTGDAATATRNAEGDYSWHVINAKAPVFAFNLGEGQLFRTGFTDPGLQEQFGGSGGPDAYPQGYPGDGVTAMSALQEITPRTVPRLKGIRLISINVMYKVGTNDLASFTMALDKTVLTNNAAVAVTNIIAAAQGNLVLTARANIYCIETAVPAAGAVFNIADLSQFWLELAPTSGAAGGSTFDLYGVRVKVEFNFN